MKFVTRAALLVILAAPLAAHADPDRLLAAQAFSRGLLWGEDLGRKSTTGNARTACGANMAMFEDTVTRAEIDGCVEGFMRGYRAQDRKVAQRTDSTKRASPPAPGPSDGPAKTGAQGTGGGGTAGAGGR